MGHALLVGSGGSGRNSLTALCAFISNMRMFNIHLVDKDWREEVKKVMEVVGVNQCGTIFFIKETQISSEMVISHILNNGEVPELFTKDEKAKYVEEMDNVN